MTPSLTHATVPKHFRNDLVDGFQILISFQCAHSELQFTCISSESTP